MPPDSALLSDTNLIMTLRAFLRQTLPEYMLPARFIIMEALPLSPSGKVDRRLLATQPLARAGREQAFNEFVAPGNEVELELCKICAELLSIPWNDEQSPIGIHDNFFELGGHSLLATQFISRIREIYKVELPLRTLFERPTIAELGKVIDQMKESGVGLEAPAIRAVSRDDRRMRQTTSGLKSIEGTIATNFSAEPGAEKKDRTE
jgi:acyl carrier protein